MRHMGVESCRDACFGVLDWKFMQGHHVGELSRGQEAAVSRKVVGLVSKIRDYRRGGQ